METEHTMLLKIAFGWHGNVTLFEATPQCLHKNSVSVSVSRIACDCEYALVKFLRSAHVRVNPFQTRSRSRSR